VKQGVESGFEHGRGFCQALTVPSLFEGFPHRSHAPSVFKARRIEVLRESRFRPNTWGMLTERFPELDRLDAGEKLILAGELWRAATQPANGTATPELPEATMVMIEARLDEYLRQPQTGTEWETLKKRILSGSDR
jgi:hypothetical protein